MKKGDSGQQQSTMAEVLVASTVDGLVAIDDQGQIIFFNPAAGRIFGVTPESMMGQSLERLMVPGRFAKHKKDEQNYFSGRGMGLVDLSGAVEAEARHSSGHNIPVEVSLSSVEINQKRVVLASLRDITHRHEANKRNRLLEEQLAHAQKMEAIGTLAAGTAHDFNNMLGAIMGYATTMLSELDAEDRHHRDVSQILNIIHRAKKLTDNLLTFSRRAESVPEILSLSRIAREVTGLLRRTLPKNIVIKTKLARAVNFEGDRSQVEQSLMNVCLNAKDAMPDGGILQIQTTRANLEEDEAFALGLTAGSFCRLSVRDNGIGMDQSTAQKALDPFFSTKAKGEGIGLGLALVMAAVSNHGGKIVINSETGKGTEVMIYLPFADEEPQPEPLSTCNENTVKGQGETILLVDDERHLRGMAKRLLEGLGYHILLAESGEEAVQIYKLQGQAINLIILDVMMEGMSGSETYDQLVVINPEVRVLVSSGYNRNGAPTELLEKGVKGFVQKPYGIDEINESIRKALKS